MKIRNYERKELITVFIVLLLLTEIIVVISLTTIKINNYFKVNGVVVKDNLMVIMVSSSERKIIYSNKVLFFNNKRFKFEIVEDRGIVMKKKNDKYYQLLLKFPFEDKSANDILEIVFIKEKIRLIEIFKIIWEGG